MAIDTKVDSAHAEIQKTLEILKNYWHSLDSNLGELSSEELKELGQEIRFLMRGNLNRPRLYEALKQTLVVLEENDSHKIKEQLKHTIDLCKSVKSGEKIGKRIAQVDFYLQSSLQTIQNKVKSLFPFLSNKD